MSTRLHISASEPRCVNANANTNGTCGFPQILAFFGSNFGSTLYKMWCYYCSATTTTMTKCAWKRAENMAVTEHHHTHNLVNIESSGKLHPSPFSLGSLLKRFDITIYIQRHSSMKWNETKRYEKKRINLLRFELWSVLNCQASVWTCERTCCSNQIESNRIEWNWSEVNNFSNTNANAY